MAWSIPFDGVKMFHLEAIVRAKDIEKKFRAELVKSVPAPIIGDRVHEKPSAFTNHFHAILQRHGKIEDVFERTTIIHQVEPGLEIGPNGLVQIMPELRPFKT